ncbi:MAG TPA: S8 family serine peptidase [Chitinophagales bacterium]|nr:S8 family serine peptidase [Chitinophagales bacterium]
MERKFFIWAIVLLLSNLSSTIAQPVSNSLPQAMASFKAYDMLNIPAIKANVNKKPVVVAVVDDGFSFSHHAIRNYLYRNEKEIAGNGIDDDGNGYVDDINGWDAADGDNDVMIPDGKQKYFFHGTMTAGIIVNVAQRCLGAQASNQIKILPVKALANDATSANMDKGYDGIRYAVKSNADIIVCAWSGGKYDRAKYESVFEEADRKGILILGSAGNFYTERIDPPASIATVLTVACADTAMLKLPQSNYGDKVDLSAPGHFVYTAYTEADNIYTYADGSSAAVSLVGGCAAVLKAISPKSKAWQIAEALKNTARPGDSLNRYYAGKLGAGVPDLSAAVNYLQRQETQGSMFSSSRPEGTIIIDDSYQQNDWKLAPYGGVKGFDFWMKGKWGGTKEPLNFYSGDSLVASYLPDNFPLKVFVPGSKVRLQYTGKRKGASRIGYAAVPVDSTTLYCRDILYTETPQGEISDGSGPADYANNCGCKWQITAPVGKRIKIEFDTFDTQPKVDYVWLFSGTTTMEEYLLAKFSGSELPPVIVSHTNQVLVWFVTNSEVTAKGWHLKYVATDEPAGVFNPATKQ